MNTLYSIIFEIADNSNRTKLVSRIAASYTYARITQNSYFIIINSDLMPLVTHVTIRDQLKEFVKPGDKLYIGVAKPPAAWAGFDTEVSEWIRQYLIL